MLERFSYPFEGWGITTDGERLIVSDGSATLRYLHPVTLEELHRVEVLATGLPLTYLNDLEWVEGEIWANIWQTDLVARICPRTGSVTGWINLIGLSREVRCHDYDEVLNGLAFDRNSGTLLVTGKHWPSLFELEIIGEGLPATSGGFKPGVVDRDSAAQVRG
jgi:glutamine cyclotransferase